MELYDAEASLPHIPDNISLSRFILEYRHEIQPARGNTPCLIDDSTGRQITLEELRERTSMLANALHSEFNLGNKDVVMLVGPNHIGTHLNSLIKNYMMIQTSLIRLSSSFMGGS